MTGITAEVQLLAPTTNQRAEDISSPFSKQGPRQCPTCIHDSYMNNSANLSIGQLIFLSSHSVF